MIVALAGSAKNIDTCFRPMRHHIIKCFGQIIIILLLNFYDTSRQLFPGIFMLGVAVADNDIGHVSLLHILIGSTVAANHTICGLQEG